MQAGGRNQKDDRLDRSNPVMMQRTVINRKEVKEMKKFDLLKSITGEKEFSNMVFGLIEIKKLQKHLLNFLKRRCLKKIFLI